MAILAQLLAARFGAGVRALLALNRRTLELFDAYREAGIRFEMYATGLLIAARTRAGLRQYDEVFRRLRALGYEGGEPDQLDRDALVELEPALDRRNVEAGLHARVDRLRPARGAHAAGWPNAFVRKERRSSKDASSSSYDSHPDGWTVATNDGDLHAERSSWPPGWRRLKLLARFGARRRHPARARVQRHDRRKGTPPRHALYLAEAKLGLSPYSEGVRIAGVFELGASRAEAPPGAGERLLAAARPYLARLATRTDAPLVTWAGLRPATADGLPLIGALPGTTACSSPSGHGMLGVTLAPAPPPSSPRSSRGPHRTRARALRPGRR